MSNIAFVTLFDLNLTYIQMGKELDVKHVCYYISSTNKAYEELIKSGISPGRILNLSKKRNKINLDNAELNKRILSRYEDPRLSISSILFASRMLWNEKSNVIESYMAESIQRIDEFILENNIDFVITEPTDCIQLLSQLVCWRRGIKLGQIVPIRYPVNRIALSVDCFEEEFHELESQGTEKVMGLEEWLKKYRTSNLKPQYYKNALKYKPFLKLIKSLFLRIPVEINRLLGNYELNNLNTYYLIKMYLRNTIRRIFFQGEDAAELNDKNGIPKYFVYYLHVQPERSIDVVSPHYANQLENIRQLRRALPWDVELWVKDHPASDGAQPYDFYKRLQKVPGVRLIGRKSDSKKLGLNAIGIATVSGTIGYEMALNNKPVVVFSNIFYRKLPTVFQYENPEGLANFMRVIANNSSMKNKDLEIINFLKNLIMNSMESNWNFIAGKLSPQTVKSLVCLVDKWVK